ncbi:Golgi apparatus membrane protein tvp23 [Tritrichomonas musculus]|uniref:Golgi apparatus membrane protein TVP23 homolog n=1 Tax=Tritrichomonas musculus TaxID=1915356 RepID=A0ABR2JZ55_9EUKA
MNELKNEENNQDQVDLIHNHIQDNFVASAGGAERYIIVKFTVIFIYLIGVAFSFYPTLQLALVSLATIIEFWLCKNVDGLDLVGMRWSHEIGYGGDPQWIFYSRQDPYVPDPMNSNIFWFVLFGGFFIWFCIFFWAIFEFSGMNVLISFLVLAAHACNACCFLKCHSVSTKQADDVARSVLLDSSFDNNNNGNGIEGKSNSNKVNNHQPLDNVDTTDIHLDVKLEPDSDEDQHV